MSERAQKAQTGLDLALGRGGDQAAVYVNEEVQFYGGKAKVMEKSTRVKARVVAHAIRELKKLIAELKQSGCAMLISTHMIESVEENWDTTCIMTKGTIARACRRDELGSGDLEDLYFAITEGSRVKEA